MSEDKNWSKIINNLHSKVNHYTKKYNIDQPVAKISYVNINPSKVASPGFDIFKDKKVILGTVFAISTIVCALCLYIIKPSFLMIEIKNEETFFFETVFNHRLSLIISTVFGIIATCIYYKYVI